MVGVGLGGFFFKMGQEEIHLTENTLLLTERVTKLPKWLVARSQNIKQIMEKYDFHLGLKLESNTTEEWLFKTADTAFNIKMRANVLAVVKVWNLLKIRQTTTRDKYNAL